MTKKRKTELVWVNSMGRRWQVRMTPEQAAAERLRAAQTRAFKAAATRKAKAALKAYEAGKGTAKAAIEAISSRTMWCEKHQRFMFMLRWIRWEPREIFWPVFFYIWSSCEATWWHRELLIFVLRVYAPAILSDAEQKIFDALPDRVRVFRGCSRAYIKGVSWTTKRHIAEWFAEWRCFDPDPVVVTGMIDKRNIFATNNDRNEHEVILDPHQVQELSIETWVPKAA